MAKQSGLGQNFYIGGYNISGDITSLDTVETRQVTMEYTGIDKRAVERTNGLRDGSMSVTAWWNPSAGQEHDALKVPSSADKQAMYCIQVPAIGSVAALLVAKQINYSGKREDSGAYTLDVDLEGSGYGLEWGQLLTAGMRTDVAATNGTGLDTTASLAFGLQAYLQVSAFTGTDVTVKLQDSADNVSFADITSAAFTVITTSPQAQRIATLNTATVRRYVRAITTTTGGFTSVTFAVALVKNTATVVF